MAIRISGVKSSRLSDDQKEVIVASLGKYTGELELRFSSECIDDLINALTSARPATAPTAAAPSRSPAPSRSVSAGGPLQTSATGSQNAGEVRFEIPRNFAITADTSGRGMVLFIVNHRLDRQTGYAFSPDAAKQLAGGLVKSAEALISSKPPAAKE